MKAITLWRPWPISMLHHDKRIENRGWDIPDWAVGGWTALHAGRTFDKSGAASIVSIAKLNGSDITRVLDRSVHADPCIFAVARFGGSVRFREDAERWRPGQGRWFFGPYGWLIEELLPVLAPIPVMGHQGFWNVPDPIFRTLKDRGLLPPR